MYEYIILLLRIIQFFLVLCVCTKVLFHLNATKTISTLKPVGDHATKVEDTLIPSRHIKKHYKLLNSMTAYSKIDILAEKNTLHNQTAGKDSALELQTPDFDEHFNGDDQPISTGQKALILSLPYSVKKQHVGIPSNEQPAKNAKAVLSGKYKPIGQGY